MRPYLTLFMLVILFSCDSSRVFEENRDFSDAYWIAGESQNFEFEITDRNIPYQLYFNIRNGLSYKYHNIYVKYTLTHEGGREVESGLMNFDLFNPKSGKPNGSGLGDIFDHQLPILTGYNFPEPGKYGLELKQYMRNDTLEHVFSVGIRIESKLE